MYSMYAYNMEHIGPTMKAKVICSLKPFLACQLGILSFPSNFSAIILCLIHGIYITVTDRILETLYSKI